MLRHVVADAVLDLARAVDVEEGGPPRVHPFDKALEQVRDIACRALHHVGVAVGHRDERDFLADFLLVPRGGRRVKLCVEDQHLDRPARGHHA